MPFQSYATLPLIARGIVALGWLGFFGFFLLQKKPPAQKVARRDPISNLGIALQGLGYGLTWMLQRRIPRAGDLSTVEIALDVLGPILSILSAWFGLWAVRTLGKQWSYSARVVEGHQLVREGPYTVTRHPIYTAMFGILLATSCVLGHWLGLLLAAPVFIAGTMIRVRSEEKLLRETFGPEYAEYARRVPAFIPLLPTG